MNVKKLAKLKQDKLKTNNQIKLKVSNAVNILEDKFKDKKVDKETNFRNKLATISLRNRLTKMSTIDKRATDIMLEE